jgi:hypothetical protein
MLAIAWNPNQLADFAADELAPERGAPLDNV